MSAQRKKTGKRTQPKTDFEGRRKHLLRQLRAAQDRQPTDPEALRILEEALYTVRLHQLRSELEEARSADTRATTAIKRARERLRTAELGLALGKGTVSAVRAAEGGLAEARDRETVAGVQRLKAEERARGTLRELNMWNTAGGVR